MGKPAESKFQRASGRGAARLPVSMIAAFGESGASKARVNVFDLSTDGFRIATFRGVEVGSKVWLNLSGLESLRAEVMWIRKGFAGCRFMRPLHPAVLDMIVDTGGPART